MSEVDLDAKQIEKKVHDLAEAMDRVRGDQVLKDDVVVDMKQAKQARLELLARDLQPVFNDLPNDNDQFEFSLTNGENPRLWIDMTSFVRMGRDRREYEFVKDTRLGRTQLAATQDIEKMGRIVTNYVAERVLERERMIEGDWISLKQYRFDQEGELISAEHKNERESGYGWPILGLFLVGLALGAAAMVAWAWFGEIPNFLN